MKLFNRITAVKQSLVKIAIWLPKSRVSFLGHSAADILLQNKNFRLARRYRFHFWCKGHIALRIKDDLGDYYISWYPIHDLKRSFTGNFMTPYQDNLIWGEPFYQQELIVENANKIITEAFDPLFLYHYPEESVAQKGLNPMQLSVLNVSMQHDKQLFHHNRLCNFALYRPFVRYYDWEKSDPQDRSCIANELRKKHLGKFCFNRVAEPYRAGHELILFFMNKLGLPVDSIKGCYNGDIDLLSLVKLLEQQVYESKAKI